jgi:hypothetical protein
VFESPVIPGCELDAVEPSLVAPTTDSPLDDASVVIGQDDADSGPCELGPDLVQDWRGRPEQHRLEVNVAVVRKIEEVGAQAGGHRLAPRGHDRLRDDTRRWLAGENPLQPRPENVDPGSR